MCLSHVWTRKKLKDRRRSSKFSPIYSILYATRTAIKSHCSLPKKVQNASPIKKINSSIASIRHSTNTFQKIKICRQHYRNWLWASNSASKGFGPKTKESCYSYLLFKLFSSDMDALQICVVKHLEKCEESTPANLVESMFKFVRNETVCGNISPVSSTLQLSNAEHISNFSLNLI